MKKFLHYYLFELGHTVVKTDGISWYTRDRNQHVWKEDQSWFRRYYDAQYDVIEISYDETTEQITGRTTVPGFWSQDIEALLEE